MFETYQLAKYKIGITRQGHTYILMTSSKKYFDILMDAFPDFRYSTIWDEQFHQGLDWGIYIDNIGDTERKTMGRLLQLFKKTILIEDALKQTFALSYHSRPTYMGSSRTEIGELVYNSKPYHKPASENHITHANELTKHFVDFISCHPSYAKSDLIISVPSQSHKPFDLPTYLVEQICITLEIENGNGLVKKAKETKPMKDLSLEEKFENIRDAFTIVNEESIRGRLITVVDDIYQSGATLHSIASVLQKAGAMVQGLVATKTLRDSNIRY